MRNDKARLFIIGAGSLARELESWINLIPSDQKDWELIGFLHNLIDGDPLSEYPSDYTILGDWESFPFKPGDRCLIGVSDVVWREKIYNALKEKVWFIPFVAHNVVLGKHTKISEGTIICPNCTISTNVTTGKACFINCASNIGHDCNLGDYCSLMANIDLGGHVKLGNKVFMGTKSTIIPGKSIADNVRIGAGSVVIRSIKKESITVFGNPAKEIY